MLSPSMKHIPALFYQTTFLVTTVSAQRKISSNHYFSITETTLKPIPSTISPKPTASKILKIPNSKNSSKIMINNQIKCG